METYSAEVLQNGFVRIQGRGSGLVGLYYRQGQHVQGDLRLSVADALGAMRSAGIAPSGSEELRSKYNV